MNVFIDHPTVYNQITEQTVLASQIGWQAVVVAPRCLVTGWVVLCAASASLQWCTSTLLGKKKAAAPHIF